MVKCYVDYSADKIKPPGTSFGKLPYVKVSRKNYPWDFSQMDGLFIY
jgi:hypothetical protein